MASVDLLIVGAGPAGMAAAIQARSHGLDVIVLDEQPAPGGQIWRSVESTRKRDDILGPSYSEGMAIASEFRACGAVYLSSAQLWQLEAGYKASVTQGGRAYTILAKAVIFATGAQERPAPFPGWTLPGVLTVGAAQILLKSSGHIPTGKVWIAGNGPLPLLYAHQFIKAGGKLAGFLDTTPKGRRMQAMRFLPRALLSAGDLAKGLAWTMKLARGGTTIVKHVDYLEAHGGSQIEAITFSVTGMGRRKLDADVLLIHEGVVPSIHPIVASGCGLEWSDAQLCFRPRLDSWGQTDKPNLFVAGDGAGIAGARAAVLRGQLAALGAASNLGRLTDEKASAAARPVRRQLKREMAIRPFLDALFYPRPQILAPASDTMICRCEEVTAGQIRSAAQVGCPGPNQVKAATRAGMGPCQGRQCSYSITNILGLAQDRAPADVGFLNVRAPLKPLTLGELATLHEDSIT